MIQNIFFAWIFQLFRIEAIQIIKKCMKQEGIIKDMAINWHEKSSGLIEMLKKKDS